jgi:hypothetical protein
MTEDKLTTSSRLTRQECIEYVHGRVQYITMLLDMTEEDMADRFFSVDNGDGTYSAPDTSDDAFYEAIGEDE